MKEKEKIIKMEIIFSDHAVMKLSQRNIPKRLVIETVRFPDFVKPGYYLREERCKHFGKNWLKVVVIKEGETAVVVTAHWIAKIKRD